MPPSGGRGGAGHSFDPSASLFDPTDISHEVALYSQEAFDRVSLSL